MKAKSGYSGLASFSLSFAASTPELLQLSGNDARMGRINELFDAGNEQEARLMLRSTLAEITRDLDAVLDVRRDKPGPGESQRPDSLAALLLSMET